MDGTALRDARFSRVDAIAWRARRQWSDAYKEFLRSLSGRADEQCLFCIFNHPIYHGTFLVDASWLRFAL